MKNKKGLISLIVIVLLVATAIIYFLNKDSEGTISDQETQKDSSENDMDQGSQRLLSTEIKDLDDYILYSDVIITGKVVETELWHETTYETIVEVDQQFKGQSDEQIYLYHQGDSFELGQEWILFLHKLDTRLRPGPQHTLINVVSRGLIEEEMVNNGFRDLTTPISLDTLIAKINESEFIDQPNPFNLYSLAEEEMTVLADNPSLDELIAHSDLAYHVKTNSVSVANPYVVYANVDILTQFDLIENSVNQANHKEENLALPHSTEPDTEYIIFYQKIHDSYLLTTRNGSIIREGDEMWDEALDKLDLDVN